MSDRAYKPAGQRPLPPLAEFKLVQFVSDALRAGQRAILITGRGQVSVRAPEAALAACAGASSRALHIGPPLPEPPELQEMIGAAIGIAGGREMTPQAMARLLLFADPSPNVILAIDDAHMLSHRSLCYLTLMTELLTSEAPILQIVLAAGPALLETLAQPEFESLRNRLCRPAFETFQTLHGRRAAFSGLRQPGHGRGAAGLTAVQYADQASASPEGHGIALAAAYAAGGIVAVGCLSVLGYVAFSTFTAAPILPPIALMNPAAEPLAAADNGDRAASSPAAIAPPPPSAAAPGQDLDAPPPAMAQAAPAAPDNPTALSGAEPLGAADNGDRAASSPAAIAPPGAVPDQDVGLPPPEMAKAAPAAPDNPTALSGAEPLGAADVGNRAGSTAAAVVPPPPGAAPDQDVGLPPPEMGKAAPAAPDNPTAPSDAERPGAADNGDRAASSSAAIAPPPPDAAPHQDIGLPPPEMAKAAPDGAAAQVVAGLPKLAPVRVILNVARDDAGPARRSADIQRALAAAGLEVSNLVPVDAQQPRPRIGYYFQSDLNAAAEVSHLLKPLLGAVDPVALRKRGSIPEPGTIEIAIP